LAAQGADAVGATTTTIGGYPVTDPVMLALVLLGLALLGGLGLAAWRSRRLPLPHTS
jgi:hypothetical protein